MSEPFMFEPGCYGGAGCYMPSIACLIGAVETELECHHVLINSYIDFETEEEAVTQAENDLDQAVKQKELTGSDSAFDAYLTSKGYCSIEDFEVEEGDEDEDEEEEENL